MRSYRPHYTNVGISKYRYDELKAFCRQYSDKKTEAETLLMLKSPSLSGMPHGTDISDPVSRAAEKREALLYDCEMIETCAKAVDGGRFYTALIQNVCLGKGYDYLGDSLPTNNRTDFFKARRAFFINLNAVQGKR